MPGKVVVVIWAGFFGLLPVHIGGLYDEQSFGAHNARDLTKRGAGVRQVFNDFNHGYDVES